MDTRERLDKLLEGIPGYADAILAIFAEERAALQRDIATLNKAWHGALSERDATKAREAKLVEALREAREALRIYGHAMRCKYGKPGESAALPLGACTCGYFKNLMDIDAALATVKE